MLFMCVYMKICIWAQVYVDIDDTKAALRRRGPDSLGIKNIFLWPSNLDNRSVVLESDEMEKMGCGKLEFIGATLQLRGSTPITQPLVDSFGNVLVYNGMVFWHFRMFFVFYLC